MNSSSPDGVLAAVQSNQNCPPPTYDEAVDNFMDDISPIDEARYAHFHETNISIDQFKYLIDHTQTSLKPEDRVVQAILTEKSGKISLKIRCTKCQHQVNTVTSLEEGKKFKRSVYTAIGIMIICPVSLICMYPYLSSKKLLDVIHRCPFCKSKLAIYPARLFKK
uniref:LITAF domain-containing protein n=1 Tax=Rhabditophanes sp. KR3021 TaxID=114890 RepID=A0AC35TZC4_9BILA